MIKTVRMIISSGLNINRVGEPINSFYVVRYAGVDPQNGDALYYKKDGKSTTNIYDPDDRAIVGASDPPNFGGFSTTWNYKGINLDVLFSYSYGALHITMTGLMLKIPFIGFPTWRLRC